MRDASLFSKESVHEGFVTSSFDVMQVGRLLFVLSQYGLKTSSCSASVFLSLKLVEVLSWKVASKCFYWPWVKKLFMCEKDWSMEYFMWGDSSCRFDILLTDACVMLARVELINSSFRSFSYNTLISSECWYASFRLELVRYRQEAVPWRPNISRTLCASRISSSSFTINFERDLFIQHTLK